MGGIRRTLGAALTVLGLATFGMAQASAQSRNETPRATEIGVTAREIRIAVIAVPAPSAQHVLNLVVAAGIKAVLNFSPGTLQAPPDVKLKSVDLTVSLESLSFFLAQEADGET